MEWSRPASASRFNFLGVKTNIVADALPEHKYALAQNIRSYNDDEIQTRPQMGEFQAAPIGTPLPILSLESSIGIYKIGTNLYAAGNAIDTGYSTNGCSLTPFRPNASPSAWEYAWDSLQARKILIPPSGPPVVANTGLIEPQLQVEGGITNAYYNSIYSQNISVYTFAGALSNGGGSTRVTDTVAAVFPDPASPTYYSIQPTNQTQEYGIGEQVIFNAAPTPWRIHDVFPAMVGTISISSITYYTGTTGRCVVVPFTIGSPAEDGAGATLQQENAFARLRRGSLINFSTGETCFVLSVTDGPAGAVAFEVSTVSNHTAAETFIGLNAFAICTQNGNTLFGTPVAGNSITKATTLVNLTSGIGTVNPTSGISGNPFVFNGSPFREDDYITFSLEFINGLENLVEMKLLIDVGDGTFESDFYYATFRPADIMAAVVNNLTTLGTAQIAAQRETIDQESQAKGQTLSSAQTSPGANTWSDISFPIRDLTRVGSDPTKSLQTMVNYQFLFNSTGNAAVNIALDFSISGGYAADTGDTGNPYLYRIRPRASTTGVKGNPSPLPRYGIAPRRTQVSLTLPTSYPDPQMDTWDIFRIGGTLDKWTQVGSVPVAMGSFNDIYPDDTVRLNPILDFDNLQPFPSIGDPLTGTAVVGGYLLTVTFPLGSSDPVAAKTLAQIGNLLPGNLINIGQQFYTLQTRPTFISSSSVQVWQFLLQENAGTNSSAPIIIYEPLLAAQALPYVWGPDANGVFFAVGDLLRPGFVVRTNPKNPDSASDKNTNDLCPPTEPLQNGALISGTSIVFSPNRAWRGFPQQGGKYNWVEIPVGRGLAAPFGICTDGKIIYYWAKDGICATSGGVSVSLTDDDLYNLFPHEGIFASDYSYGGQVISAPDYSRIATFRLAVVNGWLFADYQNSSGQPRSLVCNLARKAWSTDVYARPITVRSAITLPTSVNGSLQQQMFAGTTTGEIDIELSTPNPSGGQETVACVLATKEEMYGDIRATKLFGDASLDAVLPSGLTTTPMSFGHPQTPTTFPVTTPRPQLPLIVDLLGEIRARSLGALLTWTDLGKITVLYSIQFSYITQPEDTTDRFSDWTDAGYLGNKFWQGFKLMADTTDVVKGLIIRDAETLATHDFSSIAGTNKIQHNGQTVIAYSFNTPFLAHQVRYEPDEISWREFKIEWVWERSPELVYNWKIQPTAHGLAGWQHLRQNQIVAHRSTADITLTIVADGAPTTYTIPNSAGAFVKTIVPLQAIKALVHSYQFASTQPFSLWLDDQEFYVGDWGRSAPYRNFRLTGSTMGNRAEI